MLWSSSDAVVTAEGELCALVYRFYSDLEGTLGGGRPPRDHPCKLFPSILRKFWNWVSIIRWVNLMIIVLMLKMLLRLNVRSKVICVG
jgi:hypothetical protein